MSRPRNMGTIPTAAERYKVSEKTIRRWISTGVLYAERVGPRLIRVDLDSLQGRPLQYLPPTAASDEDAS